MSDADRTFSFYLLAQFKKNMKLLYHPKGKAYEYCHWACNLYNGCSNLCSYCYNRKGLAYKLLGKDTPTLKSCVKTEEEAYELFKKELMQCKVRILSDGGELFFNFVSDPCLPETINLNFRCILFAMSEGITCRLLTKRIEIVETLQQHVSTYTTSSFAHMRPLGEDFIDFFERLKVGFTLTGCDEMEPGASSNAERINAMKELKMFYTWASIEPVIDIER